MRKHNQNLHETIVQRIKDNKIEGNYGNTKFHHQQFLKTRKIL